MKLHSTLKLAIQIDQEADRDKVFLELCELSSHLQVNVAGTYRGVPFIASPSDTAGHLEYRYLIGGAVK